MRARAGTGRRRATRPRARGGRAGILRAMSMDTTVGQDELWMRRALELAARGDCRTGHNPKVGAILVRQGQVLGEGYHQVSGSDHAEVIAVNAALAAGHDLRGATLYVTLEPCTAFPHKRTPACIDLLLAHHIGRAVIAMEDPNPHVAGASIARLRARGIDVRVGVHEQQARLLNAPYIKWVLRGQPFVTACWALSPDRRTAPRLRSQVDAVLVDVALVQRRDPLLTRGHVPGKDAMRVVVDPEGRLPVTSRLVQTARSVPVLVLTSERAAASWQQAMDAHGVEVAPLAWPQARPGTPLDALPDHGRAIPAACLAALAQRNLRTVLIEQDTLWQDTLWQDTLRPGGDDLLAAFLRSRAVDRFVCAVPARALPARAHLHVELVQAGRAAGPAGPGGDGWIEISGLLPADWLRTAGSPGA